MPLSQASQDLLKAAQAKNLADVEKALKEPDVDVNAQDEGTGNTALHYVKDYPDIMKAILNHTVKREDIDLPDVNVRLKNKKGEPIDTTKLATELNQQYFFILNLWSAQYAIFNNFKEYQTQLIKYNTDKFKYNTAFIQQEILYPVKLSKKKLNVIITHLFNAIPTDVLRKQRIQSKVNNNTITCENFIDWLHKRHWYGEVFSLLWQAQYDEEQKQLPEIKAIINLLKAYPKNENLITFVVESQQAKNDVILSIADLILYPKNKIAERLESLQTHAKDFAQYNELIAFLYADAKQNKQADIINWCEKSDAMSFPTACKNVKTTEDHYYGIIKEYIARLISENNYFNTTYYQGLNCILQRKEKKEESFDKDNVIVNFVKLYEHPLPTLLHFNKNADIEPHLPPLRRYFRSQRNGILKELYQPLCHPETQQLDLDNPEFIDKEKTALITWLKKEENNNIVQLLFTRYYCELADQAIQTGNVALLTIINDYFKEEPPTDKMSMIEKEEKNQQNVTLSQIISEQTAYALLGLQADGKSRDASWRPVKPETKPSTFSVWLKHPLSTYTDKDNNNTLLHRIALSTAPTNIKLKMLDLLANTGINTHITSQNKQNQFPLSLLAKEDSALIGRFISQEQAFTLLSQLPKDYLANCITEALTILKPYLIEALYTIYLTAPEEEKTKTTTTPAIKDPLSQLLNHQTLRNSIQYPNFSHLKKQFTQCLAGDLGSLLTLALERKNTYVFYKIFSDLKQNHAKTLTQWAHIPQLQLEGHTPYTYAIATNQHDMVLLLYPFNEQEYKLFTSAELNKLSTIRVKIPKNAQPNSDTAKGNTESAKEQEFELQDISTFRKNSLAILPGGSLNGEELSESPNSKKCLLM